MLAGCQNKPAPPVSGDPTVGKQVYESSCEVCHLTTPGQKKVGPSLAGVYELKALPNGEPVNDKTLDRWIRNGGGMMPGFKNALSPEQMRDLLAYLKTLK